MTRKADCELLQLNLEHSLTDVKESFRHLALELHPDLGGDRDRFEAVRDAYNRLRIEAEREEGKCGTCNGQGQITVAGSSFTPIKRSCPACGGSGKVLRE